MEESNHLTKEEAVELAKYGIEVQTQSQAIEIALLEQEIEKNNKGE
ncbi:hypothetical protein [Helicobacter cappadocius]|uniref:Uncharacterized protein n=1 Tax=Helicobacter cappadocius TaxID=3063998 RepID=A0AA90TAD3_9HELI|nr:MULTISPECIES: hypothetical protein [unclassified Helicobacter]MDO7253953.1 hypothetical protein [Helicobacter sp. faydin-H75]MDP2539827.1 hypothetical protein [Helicobacter sp. faydin-H76]